MTTGRKTGPGHGHLAAASAWRSPWCSPAKGGDVGDHLRQKSAAGAPRSWGPSRRWERQAAIEADATLRRREASIDRTPPELGGLDILVDNAGILRLAEMKDIASPTSTRCWTSTCARRAGLQATMPHLRRADGSSRSEPTRRPRPDAGAPPPRGAASRRCTRSPWAGAGSWTARRHHGRPGQPGSTDRHEPGRRPFADTPGSSSHSAATARRTTSRPPWPTWQARRPTHHRHDADRRRRRKRIDDKDVTAGPRNSARPDFPFARACKKIPLEFEWRSRDRLFMVEPCRASCFCSLLSSCRCCRPRSHGRARR